jgi:hypothetical protein
MWVRVSALLLAAGGLAWFSFGQDSSASALIRRTMDLADDRPVRSILIVGNSRTYTNDMAAMLRDIADSAESPAKWQIETSAKPAFSLENHWFDHRTRRLLAAGHDEVLIQGESGAEYSQQQGESYRTYGAKLAGAARLDSGRATLLVNWPSERSVFSDDPDYDRAVHLDYLRSINARLAEDAELDRINLAGLWESVRRSDPSIKLTSDGNHPTVAGTYLYALAVYRHFSGGEVGKVAYAPTEIDPTQAAALRRAVDSFPMQGM